MKQICEDIKAHTDEVIAEWEKLVREQPWYSLPRDHRVANLPEVVVGLVEASLCDPVDREAHRQKAWAAAEHGQLRRAQGVSEMLIFTELHLLRHAIWRYLMRTVGPTDRAVDAINRIDTAMTLATNAALWGYHREEIEALGKWPESLEALVEESPFLKGRGRG